MASEITPNLTFLYLRIGLVYRHFKSITLPWNTLTRRAINEQLGVRDPLPYIAIAKTYAQQGEFFIASRNAEKALSLRPHQRQYVWAIGHDLRAGAQLRDRPADPALRGGGLFRRGERNRLAFYGRGNSALPVWQLSRCS